MKRKADFDLNRNEIENGNFEVPQKQDSQTGNPIIQSNTDVPQRRIVKLKIPDAFLPQKNPVETANIPKPTFQLTGNLSISTKNENKENKEVDSILQRYKVVQENANNSAPSFLLKNPLTSKEVQPVETKPLLNLSKEKPSIKSPSLFAPNFTQKQPDNQLLAQGVGQNKTENPSENVPSLFSSIPKLNFAPINSGGPSFFSKPQNTEDKLKCESPGLFAQKPSDNQEPKRLSIFTNIQPTGPFSAKKEETTSKSSVEEKKEGQSNEEGGTSEVKDEKKSSLFAAVPVTNTVSAQDRGRASLFENTNNNGKPSVTSLFSTQNNSSLFAKPDDDELSNPDDEDDDDEPQRSESPEPEHSKNDERYMYEETYEKIAVVRNKEKYSKLLAKSGEKPIQPYGEVSINKAKNSDAFFLIYRNKAKLIQYQGQILKKLSATSYLNPRQDAIMLYAFSKKENCNENKEEKDDVTNPQFSKDAVKLMFNTSTECNAFKKELDSIIN